MAQKNDKDKDIDPELVKTFVKHVNSLSVVFKTVLAVFTARIFLFFSSCI